MHDENTIDAGHEKIKAELELFGGGEIVDNLRDICEERDLGRLVLAIKKVVPDYSPS